MTWPKSKFFLLKIISIVAILIMLLIGEKRSAWYGKSGFIEYQELVYGTALLRIQLMKFNYWIIYHYPEENLGYIMEDEYFFLDKTDSIYVNRITGYSICDSSLHVGILTGKNAKVVLSFDSQSAIYERRPYISRFENQFCNWVDLISPPFVIRYWARIELGMVLLLLGLAVSTIRYLGRYI